MHHSQLLIPTSNELVSLWPQSQSSRVEERSSEIHQEMKSLLGQRNYPCVAAIQSFFRKEYMTGVYENFGTGQSWQNLRSDLGLFHEQLKESRSPYLTFWAVFDQDTSKDEEDFEKQLWNELSHLTSIEDAETDWPEGATKDPNQKQFCLHLFGASFFVVGLHPKASRKSHRFPWPTLIFNAFSQFQELQKQGIYDRMVETNRKRDVMYEGSANPMAVQHGDDWETIQFSGRENTKEWKCPFAFLHRSAKAST